MANFIQPLLPNIKRTHVQYANRFGIRLSANLYYLTDLDLAKQHPAIIVGPPFGGVKEQGPHIYAQQLASRGYVTLAFDPSYNGESGGQPRHLADPSIFMEDFSAGVDFLGTRPFVDRKKLAALGICGSGSFALGAAQVDPRIKAVVTASMTDIAGSATSFYDNKQAIIDHLKEVANQRYTDFLDGEPELRTRGSALQVDQASDPISKEFGEFYSTERGYHHNSIGQFTTSSDQALMNFDMLNHLDWLGDRPVMIISGEQAFSRPLQEAIYNRIPGPKKQVIVPGANHIDLYDQVQMIPWTKIDRFLIQSFNNERSN